MKSCSRHSFRIARSVDHQQQRVAHRSERPAVQPAETAAGIGRDAAEHRIEREAAFDRDVENRSVGKRVDPDDLAALHAEGPHPGDPGAGRRALIRPPQNFDAGIRADAGQLNAVRLYDEARAGIENFQRAGAGRIADQRIERRGG